MNLPILLRDPIATAGRLTYLLDLAPTDSSGAVVALRVSTRCYRTAPGDSPANASYMRRLVSPPATAHTLWSPDSISSGATLPTFGRAVLGNADGRLDSFRSYRFSGTSYTLRAGDVQESLANFSVVATGAVESVTFGVDTIELELAGFDRLFDRPLSDAVYRGTGGCLHLASGATVSLGTPSALNLTGSVTIACNVYHDSGGATENIVGWFGGTRYPWALRKGSGDKLLFMYTHSAGTTASQASSAGLSAGGWWHVAAIVSGSALTLMLYEWASGREWVETYTLAAGTRDANSGSTLRFGSASSGLVGYLDETHVWSTARAQDDVRDARVGPLASIPGSCVGLWRFDDGGGTTVADASATAANGTTSGTVDWVASGQGDEELAGTPVAEAWGYYWHQEPKLVDAATQLYKVAAGAQQTFTPYEGGKAITLGTDYTDRLAFLKATPGAGTYHRFKASGMFKLASTPTLPLTVSGEGSTDGGYANTAGALVRRLVTLRGPRIADPSGLDTASFTAFEAAATQPVGLYYADAVPLRQALDELMASVGGRWGYAKGSGLFGVIRFEGPKAASSTIRRNVILSLGTLPSATSYARALIYWRPYGRALGPHEISSSVSSSTRAQLQRGWRRVIVEVPGADPRGETLELYTRLESRAAALAEGRRLLSLLNGYRVHELTVTLFGELVVPGDSVAVVFDVGGAPRLGYDGTAAYAVVSSETAAEGENVVLRLVGP